MDYWNYFGSVEEQIKEIRKIEDELLIRKIVSIGVFSNILKKRKQELFLCDNRYGTVEICCISEANENKYGINNVEMMLATNWCYDTMFIHENSILIQSLLYINDLIKNEDARDIGIKQKIFIDTSNNEWLKAIFRILQKDNLYNLLMTKVLDSELDVKEGKSGVVKV